MNRQASVFHDAVVIVIDITVPATLTTQIRNAYVIAVFFDSVVTVRGLGVAVYHYTTFLPLLEALKQNLHQTWKHSRLEDPLRIASFKGPLNP